MGFFDRFTFARKKKVPSPTAQDSLSPITVFDKFGRRYEIPKDEWRAKVLPDMLTKANDDPASLYRIIFDCFQHGFFKDVNDASLRLLVIDPDRERSHTVRAIVLMKTGRLDEADKMLSGYIQEFGASGVVLTNLAKVYAERGDQTKAESTLWEAICLDPNQDNGLMWWAMLEKERKGESGFWEALLKAAELPGSWRPQLWLARHCLEQKRLEQAMRLYDHVLSASADQPDVLMMASGDLGNNGYSSEMLKLILPQFDPQLHEIRAGLNLLKACVTTKNVAEGESLLHRLFALERPDLKEHLLHYSDELDKLREPNVPRPLSVPVDMVSFPLDRPIWWYGLHDPQWLCSQHRTREEQVAFISLANTSRTDLKKPSAQREDDLGRLTRAIPLYLTEAVFLWTGLSARTVIPVVRNGGLVVSGTEWPEDQMFALTEGTTFVVTGSICQNGSRFDMRLSIWNHRDRKIIKTIAKSGAIDQIGAAVLRFDSELLTIIAAAHAFKTPSDVWYRRPAQAEIDLYLRCLGQSLSMSVVHNALLDKISMWGERRMLEQFLALVLQMPDAQVPRIMLVSALSKAKDYGSEAHTEYKDQTIQLLNEEKDRNSPFYRLSPLLFRIFGMAEESRLRAKELAQCAEPAYRAWLDSITKEAF